MSGQVRFLAQQAADAVEPRYGAGKPSVVAASPATTIDLVRELLHGDAMRHQGHRVDKLEEAIEALDQRIRFQFEEMQTSIEALAHSVRQSQGAQRRKIGEMMMVLGREIAGLDEPHDRSAEKN